MGVASESGDAIKIVDGTAAVPHSYPYQVSLQLFHPKTKNWYHFCGGSILDEKTVITAAHCIEGFEKLKCRVDAGDHDLTKTEGTEQVSLYFPYEAFVYPLYDRCEFVIRRLYQMNYFFIVICRSVIDYDYAIIKLKIPLTFNENVQPIMLPEEGTAPSNDCWSTGWGNVRGDGKLSFPAILQQTPTPLADKDNCTANYSTIDFAITDRMVCAGGPDSANATYHGICQV